MNQNILLDKGTQVPANLAHRSEMNLRKKSQSLQ